MTYEWVSLWIFENVCSQQIAQFCKWIYVIISFWRYKNSQLNLYHSTQLSLHCTNTNTNIVGKDDLSSLDIHVTIYTILLCIVNIYNIVGTSLNDVVLCTITLFYFSIISVFWHPFCGFVNAANTKLKWCVRIYYTHIHKRKMITLCCNVCNKFIVTIKSLVASQYCACATWMYMWCCGSLIICDFKFYSTHNTGMNNALSWIMFKFTHNSASRSN